MNFSVKEGEFFNQCWERFKDLLQACPHYAFKNWTLVGFFYDALWLAQNIAYIMCFYIPIMFAFMVEMSGIAWFEFLMEFWFDYR